MKAKSNIRFGFQLNCVDTACPSTTLRISGAVNYYSGTAPAQLCSILKTWALNSAMAKKIAEAWKQVEKSKERKDF